MSALDQRALAPPRILTNRSLASLGGVTLAAAVGFLVWRVAPAAPHVIAFGLAGAAGAPVIALALSSDDEALPKLILAALLGAGLAIVGGLMASDEARLQLFSLAMVALVAALTVWLVANARNRVRLSLGGVARFAATVVALSAYSSYLVLASRDLMIADFMTYRSVAIAIAKMADAGNLTLLLTAALESIAQDYSWAPALAPGLVLAMTAPFSRAVYTVTLIAFYAAPAAIALAILARDLARRAGLKRDAGPTAALLAFGAVAVFAAYPAGMAVAARGMVDIGGVVLTVCALRLAERLARLIALRRGHDARMAGMTRRVAVALALTLFTMFAFRRWYAFAAVGIAATLALEVTLIGLRRGAAFRWRDAAVAAALGALILIALASPVIVGWLPNLGEHDYASAYAAYRKSRGDFLSELADWVGLLPALAALAGAAFLWTRSSDRRLLRLTVGAAGVAAALFLRIQTPYIHHLYLIAPALAAPIAAALMVVFASAPRAALALLGGLAALTLSPLAQALNPAGLAPIAGLPNAPRADLDELERMKDWVDARQRAGALVCGLGSSYTFSGQLIGELWQLHPERQALQPQPRADVKMSDVDSVEGPPVAGLKDCAFLIVGDPVQTHLDPDYQQTVIVPSREMLEGQGIGAKFRRTGEVFHLEKSVSAVVFERIAPLGNADVASLQARWRAARAALGFDERGRK
jgi:hypothetical protein